MWSSRGRVAGGVIGGTIVAMTVLAWVWGGLMVHQDQIRRDGDQVLP